MYGGGCCVAFILGFRNDLVKDCSSAGKSFRSIVFQQNGVVWLDFEEDLFTALRDACIYGHVARVRKADSVHISRKPQALHSIWVLVYLPR